MQINFHCHCSREGEILHLLHENRELLISINSKIENKMSALSDQLKSINDQFNKSFKEFSDKIAALEAAIGSNNDTLSPESQAALDDLKATAQKFDDANPDEAPTEPQA